MDQRPAMVGVVPAKILNAQHAVEVAGGDDRVVVELDDAPYRAAGRRQHGHRRQRAEHEMLPAYLPEQEQRDGDEPARELEVRGQHQRRDDSDQRRAERATQRDHQVEPCQVHWCRLQSDQLAVAEHAGQKQPAAEDSDLEGKLVRQLRVGERPCHDAEAGREHREKRVAPVPALAVEAEDEREQVDRERRDPEQWHGGDVLRDVVGHREQQQRPGRGQHAPEDLAGGGRRRLVRDCVVASFAAVRWRADGGSGRVLQARPARGGAQTDEEHVGDRPAHRLRARRRPRLEQERVADEREHRRQIRQREQPVRARAGPRAREPYLDQRARRRQQEVRQPDGRHQQAQDQPRRALGAGRLPVRARDDRKQCNRHDQQHRVQLDLRARTEPVHDEVASTRSLRAARSGRRRGTSSRPRPSRRTTAGSASRRPAAPGTAGRR